MIKRFTVLSVLIFTLCQMQAQQLLSPSYTFSHSKTAYITLADGTEIQGTIKDVDRKKGLIDFIKLKDGSGKKHKLKPEQVKFMYLPPSGLDKLGKGLDMLVDAQKWNNEKLNQDLLSQGYVYFEMTDVKIKKKNRKLLMQLLNPNFSKDIKVYDDPFAKQSMSVGLGPVTAAGGEAKSYYIAKGDQPAYKVKKKDYKKEFVPFWKSCDVVVNKFPKQKWTDLVQHVLAYSECSK